MALNFGMMQPANISGQMLAGQQQAQQNQLAQQQLKQSEMQTQQSTMQMEQMQRDRDALGKLQAQFVANGKSPDLEANADAMMASGIQHYVDVGMQIKQKLQQQKQFAEIMGGGTPAPVAPAMPANALAPPSSESAAPTAPVNALAPMQAAPVDQAALLQQRINQAYALNSPQSLAWAKSMEGLRQQQMTAATAEAGRKVTERGQDIGASTAKAGQESVAATAKAGQGITLRGQNLTNQRAIDTLAQGKIPTGYRAVAGGGVEPIPGGPASGDKPLNESQGSATAYGMRMQEANKTLTDLEKRGETDTGVISGVVGGVAGMVPLIGDKLQGATGSLFNALPGIMGGLSADQQQVVQSRINFITAQLRKESGASIAPSEFATAEKLYFPKPGDTQAVIDAKAKTRKTAIEAMKVQAGPGAKHISTGGGSTTATDPLGLR